MSFRTISIFSIWTVLGLATLPVLIEPFLQWNVLIAAGRMVILVAMVVLFLVSTKTWGTDRVIIVAFLGYLLVMVAFSTDQIAGFSAVLRVIGGMGIYFVGIFAGRVLGHDVALTNPFRTVVYVLVSFFVISQIFGWGGTVYLEDGFHTSSVYITNILVYSIFLLLGFGWLTERIGKRSDLTDKIVAGMAILIIMVIFRRSSILAIGFGTVAWLLFSENRGKGIRLLVACALFASILSPLYLGTLVRHYEYRDPVAAMEDPDFGRHKDLRRALDIFQERPFEVAMLGEEVLQSRAVLGTRRPMHNDYGSLLMTTGLIGLLGYVSVYTGIACRLGALYVRGFITGSALGSGAALILTSLIYSYTNQIWVISSLSFCFLSLGLLVGVGERNAELAGSREK